MIKDQNEMIPFLSVASSNFENDLNVIKKTLIQFERRTHSENAYRFSERATMAAGWWFFDIFFKREFVHKIFELSIPHDSSNDKDKVAKEIVELFQNQLKKNNCNARIKMHGDVPFASWWWSWLMK